MFHVPDLTPNPAESHASSASPLTLTLTHSDRVLTLKRKRESAKTGRWQKDEQLWRYSRNRLSHEEEQNDHGQKLFYCEFCAWCNTSSNAASHLKTRHSCRKSNPPACRASAEPVYRTRSSEHGFQKGDRQCPPSPRHHEERSRQTLFP